MASAELASMSGRGDGARPGAPYQRSSPDPSRAREVSVATNEDALEYAIGGKQNLRESLLGHSSDGDEE